VTLIARPLLRIGAENDGENVMGSRDGEMLSAFGSGLSISGVRCVVKTGTGGGSAIINRLIT
jgi:hypothetical protein